jgi:hypothetical protein
MYGESVSDMDRSIGVCIGIGRDHPAEQRGFEARIQRRLRRQRGEIGLLILEELARGLLRPLRRSGGSRDRLGLALKVADLRPADQQRLTVLPLRSLVPVKALRHAEDHRVFDLFGAGLGPKQSLGNFA